MNRLSISAKISFLVLAMVTVAVIIISVLSFELIEGLETERNYKKLNNHLEACKNQINTYYFETEEQFKTIESILQPHLKKNNKDSNDFLNNIYPKLISVEPLLRFKNFVITDANRKIILKQNTDELKTNYLKKVSDNLSFKSKSWQTKKIEFGEMFIEQQKQYLPLRYTILSPSDSTLGYIYGCLNLEQLFKKINDSTSLGTGVEVVISTIINNKLHFLSRKMNVKDKNMDVKIGDPLALNNQVASLGKRGYGLAIDYKNNEVLSAYCHIPSFKWGLEVKANKAEIERPLIYLLEAFIIIGVIIFIITLIFALILAKIIVSPFQSLQAAITTMARGTLIEPLPVETNDEIGRMTSALNTLIIAHIDTAIFADKIGQGDLEAEYDLLSEGDTMGIALLNMRDNLRKNKRLISNRAWITNAEVEVANITRKHENAPVGLCQDYINLLAEHFSIVYAGIYLTDINSISPVLYLLSSVKEHPEWQSAEELEFGEGLTGFAFKEKAFIYQDEKHLPKYVTEQNIYKNGTIQVRGFLSAPLMYNSNVIGVIEMVLTEGLNDIGEEFIKKTNNIVSFALFSSRQILHTRDLLSAQKNLTLALEQRQAILNKQVEEINNARKRLQIIMERATEIIAIYNIKGILTYVSPSIEKILGYKPEELIGINDDHLAVKNKQDVSKRWRFLLNNPGVLHTLRIAYKHKNGNEVYLESVGTNLLNDPAIQGILVNARDITSSIEAEKEARMRNQMQALSENTTDIILRIGRLGKVYYINKAIKNLIQVEVDQIIGNFFNVQTIPSKELVNIWTGIFQQALITQNISTIEAEIKIDGFTRFLFTKAIPEFNEEKRVESILLVCSDITERKIIEQSIILQSQKINESINYSRRIQASILPSERDLKELLPESFIIYHPKDVVSGDFPWFYKRSNDIYIAVVDCTGHGVPGALLSLVGYFLLEEIATLHAEPAEILHRLDLALNQTLKGENEHTSHLDGMDIALLRINTKAKYIQFAGAHRPLLVSTKEEVIEVKGSRHSIGSQLLKDGRKFYQENIAYHSGNRLLIFSDGFADQFGGQSNKKFTSKRIKQILSENAHLSIDKLGLFYDTELDTHKGLQKQTDDIIMIGLELP